MSLVRRGEKSAPASLLVSACLLGIPCRYDGGANVNEELLSLLKDWDFLNFSDVRDAESIIAKPCGGRCVLVVCPEQMGGLSTPRPRSWFVEGSGDAVLDGAARLVNEVGQDVTAAFLRGAQLTARVAMVYKTKFALLKTKSPSCGCERVYVGDKLQKGCGVAVALLRRNGVRTIPVNRGESVSDDVRRVVVSL